MKRKRAFKSWAVFQARAVFDHIWKWSETDDIIVYGAIICQLELTEGSTFIFEAETMPNRCV